ncbi:MAG: Unknown protein [uncultured Sulfurovum sp.]|uniref:Uncharacterized protein n=1 Tax=uncultured Sulfurovum sp. TaxID=269237 RepID=A0A6S6S1W1_9BACT|nr:MAG: Unknown protein [uncultured Sulfurovum sp.]
MTLYWSIPFTDLSKTKKRPVLIIKDENRLNDFVCFQITSKSTQEELYPIDNTHLNYGELKLTSFVKYDKCFTLSSDIVNKKLASVNNELLEELKRLFSLEVF